MPSDAPSRVGPYEMLREIGRGGMGVVYLARDTTLDREVAIKTLPEALADDAERLARFEREAKLLASLHHSHIAGVYGLEEQHGVRYLILEYVDGETLDALIEHGPMLVDDVLSIAGQIAEAFEAAHEKGVVHRDLKPANVKITSDGEVKVLDFGLAKGLDGRPSTSNLGDSPTAVAGQSPTVPGVILGTAGYMSPEQARGKAVDKRSDIWSFGCVLYEMLTGEQVFPGETVTDSLGAILHKEPAWDALPAGTPPTIQVLLRRCLQKDRRKRLHDIGDARVQIEEAIADPSGSTLGLSGTYVAVSSPRSKKALLPWLAVAVFATLAAVAWWRPGTTREIKAPPARTTRVALVSPDVEVDWEDPDFDLSPDGRQVVFVASPLVAKGADPERDQLYIRRFDDFVSTPIPGTEGAWSPSFSPSGRWVAFFSSDPSTGRRLLKRVALDGSPAITICDVTHETFWSLFWLSEDTLLLNRGVGVEDSFATVSADSGALERVEFKTEELGDFLGLQLSTLLPGGKTALGTVWRLMGTQARSDAILISLEDWTCRKILDNAGAPMYAASGHLLFERDRALLAAPFDAASGEVTGNIMPLVSGVEEFDIAESGVLVYHPTAGSLKSRRLMTVDARGNIQPLSPVQKPFQYGLASSADGRWLGVITWDENELPRIWLYELQTGLIRPLTPADEVCLEPAFSLDGRYVSYVRWNSKKPGIMVAPVDGAEEAREIFSFELSAGWWGPDCWTADGQAIFFTRYGTVQNDRDILRLDLDADLPKPVLASAARESGARLSPNGKWLAYQSNETGEDHVHIRSYDAESGAVGPSRQVTTEPGASQVSWSPDGGKIHFVDRNKHLLAVTVATDPELTLSKPETVLNVGDLRTTDERMIPLQDGERFVFIQKGEQEKEKKHLNVVLNWFEELKQRVPGGEQ